MIFKPYNYQRYCLTQVINKPALGLFLDMGLGKTAVTLTAINDLRYNKFAISRTLVIAPKKVAETVWSREAEKWEHLRLLRVIKVLGTSAQRVAALNTPGDVWVINLENVAWLVDQYGKWPFDMVVADELSSFKNHQAQRFKSLVKVRGQITRFVGLTGTPTPQGLIDLFAQVYLIDGGQHLGKRITHYRERYFDPDKRSRTQIFSYKPKPGAEEAIYAAIGDICISMKAEDYLELPALVVCDTSVVLNPLARARYEEMERDMLLNIDTSEIDAGTAAVLTNKLLQISNGAVYDEFENVVEVHSCKIESFVELVEGLGGQAAIVFYSFRHDRDRIIIALQNLHLRVKELRGDREVDEWNSGEIDILLAHPASCAYGLNLQAGGNHIIWFGLTWSLERYQQANARLHRQGQTKPVIVHRLVTVDSVEEDVIQALGSKGETQNRLMECLKARIESAREGRG